MILPIAAYGHPVLRKPTQEIGPDYPDLQQIIANLWETMYHSNGVGIAAPQVNLSLRLFVVDTLQIVEGFDDEDRAEFPEEKGLKQVFINAQKLEESGEIWAYNEGCLSIPRIREDIRRKSRVKLRYLDADFQERIEEFEGITARVILHEYDHIEGKLFIDYLSSLKKRLLRKKLADISAGRARVDYRLLLP